MEEAAGTVSGRVAEAAKGATASVIAEMAEMDGNADSVATRISEVAKRTGQSVAAEIAAMEGTAR